MNSIRNRLRSHGVRFTRPRASHETGDFYRNDVNVSLNFHLFSAVGIDVLLMSGLNGLRRISGRPVNTRRP
jgi:hypothetical protein